MADEPAPELPPQPEPIAPSFDPRAWYWFVAEHERIWSSETGGWVDAAPAGFPITGLASEAELTEVLHGHGLPGPTD